MEVTFIKHTLTTTTVASTWPPEPVPHHFHEDQKWMTKNSFWLTLFPTQKTVEIKCITHNQKAKKKKSIFIDTFANAITAQIMLFAYKDLQNEERQ